MLVRTDYAQGRPHGLGSLPPISMFEFSADERRRLQDAMSYQSAASVAADRVRDDLASFETRAPGLTAHPMYNGRIVTGGMYAMRSPRNARSPRTALKLAHANMPI